MLDTILTLARVFHDAGKEFYLVGGTVRDLLLGRGGSPDTDVTTNARPDEIKRLVAATHPIVVVTVGEQFGTVRVHYRKPEGAAPEPPESLAPSAVIANYAPDVDIVEITTYRSDRYVADSRKPDVSFGDTLAGDLLRRDFTINALARDPLSGEIVDPYGGREDLARGLIRAVGDDPDRRFDEDPLRMLRAARFAAQFGFEIELQTAQSMRKQAATLAKISKERIRDEFTKLLVTPYPAAGIRLLVDLDLMPFIVPEVLELKGVSQRPMNAKPARSKDVYEHVLRVVERSPARPATRWAALLHDIAKPRTRSVENGAVHFFGHEDVGAAMARDVLRRLKFDKPFIEHVTKLVRMHMRANSYLPDWTDGAVRRLMLEANGGLVDLLDLSRADITSYRPEKVSRAVARVDELEARCAWLHEEAERVPLKSPLDGNDLMRLFGRGPGPWLRPVKEHLLGLVLDGVLAPDARESAEREARLALDALEVADQGDGARSAPAVVVDNSQSTQIEREVAPGDASASYVRATKQAARLAARRQSRLGVEAGAPPDVPNIR